MARRARRREAMKERRDTIMAEKKAMKAAVRGLPGTAGVTGKEGLE